MGEDATHTYYTPWWFQHWYREGGRRGSLDTSAAPRWFRVHLIEATSQLFCFSDYFLLWIFWHYFVPINCVSHESEETSAKHSANKKLIIKIELIKEIIENHKRGVHVVDLASQLDRRISNICTFSVLKTHENFF